MKWLNELIGRKQFQQLEVDQLLDLSLIHQDNVNFVFLKRPVDDNIELFGRYLIQSGFKGINEAVNSRTVTDLISNRLNDEGFHSVGKLKLIQDIVKITQLFLHVTHAEQIRLILKVVGDDACRKFHTDGYDLRLLCTYLGKGTEWIEDRYVNRRKLVAGSNEEIIKDPSKIKHTDPFEVAILKGEVQSRPYQKGIVHRSPPVQQTGEKRLLLRLDF